MTDMPTVSFSEGQTIRTNTIMEHMLLAYDILAWQVAQQRVSEADLLITPDVVDIDPARLGNRGARRPGWRWRRYGGCWVNGKQGYPDLLSFP